MAIVIKIPKNPTKKELGKIKEKIEKLPRKNIGKHFGKLKRPMDGLEYQKMIRNEWS